MSVDYYIYCTVCLSLHSAAPCSVVVQRPAVLLVRYTFSTCVPTNALRWKRKTPCAPVRAPGTATDAYAPLPMIYDDTDQDDRQTALTDLCLKRLPFLAISCLDSMKQPQRRRALRQATGGARRLPRISRRLQGHPSSFSRLFKAQRDRRRKASYGTFH